MRDVDRPKRLLFNAFTMNCVSHIQHGLWVRDDTRQLHPSLRAWSDLPEDMRQRNYDAIRELPAILADAGFRIVRT